MWTDHRREDNRQKAEVETEHLHCGEHVVSVPECVYMLYCICDKLPGDCKVGRDGGY